MFTALNVSGIIPNFDGVAGDVSTDLTNETLLIFQDIFVGPDGKVNVSTGSNLNGLFDTNLINDISNISSVLVLPQPSTTASPGGIIGGAQNESINSPNMDTDTVTNKPWLLEDKIDLDNIAESDLRYIIMTNMPNIDNDTIERISGILKSHGGSIYLSMLDDILRNTKIPDKSFLDSDDNKLFTTSNKNPTPTIIQYEDDFSFTTVSSINNKDDGLTSTTTVSSQDNSLQTGNGVSETTSSIIEEKTEKLYADEEQKEKAPVGVNKESDNTGSSTVPSPISEENIGVNDNVMPEDRKTVTDPGHTDFPITPQTNNLSEVPESSTIFVSGIPPGNLADDSHQLFSETEDNLATSLMPETTSEESPLHAEDADDENEKFNVVNTSEVSTTKTDHATNKFSDNDVITGDNLSENIANISDTSILTSPVESNIVVTELPIDEDTQNTKADEKTLKPFNQEPTTASGINDKDDNISVSTVANNEESNTQDDILRETVDVENLNVTPQILKYDNVDSDTDYFDIDTKDDNSINDDESITLTTKGMDNMETKVIPDDSTKTVQPVLDQTTLINNNEEDLLTENVPKTTSSPTTVNLEYDKVLPDESNIQDTLPNTVRNDINQSVDINVVKPYSVIDDINVLNIPGETDESNMISKEESLSSTTTNINDDDLSFATKDIKPSLRPTMTDTSNLMSTSTTKTLSIGSNDFKPPSDTADYNTVEVDSEITEEPDMKLPTATTFRNENEQGDGTNNVLDMRLDDDDTGSKPNNGNTMTDGTDTVTTILTSTTDGLDEAKEFFNEPISSNGQSTLITSTIRNVDEENLQVGKAYDEEEINQTEIMTDGLNQSGSLENDFPLSTIGSTTEPTTISFPTNKFNEESIMTTTQQQELTKQIDLGKPLIMTEKVESTENDNAELDLTSSTEHHVIMSTEPENNRQQSTAAPSETINKSDVQIPASSQTDQQETGKENEPIQSDTIDSEDNEDKNAVKADASSSTISNIKPTVSTTEFVALGVQSTTETPGFPRKVKDENTLIILNESSNSNFSSNQIEDAECYRRYTSRERKPDISYYNTTVRTRLLTAICLEGISCKPEEDSTRCNILHTKCNEHVNTTNLSFSMRVTLSECTVEDILCHLGHRTPVMCCQDKYSQCVHTLASHSKFHLKNDLDPTESTISVPNASIPEMIPHDQTITNGPDNHVFVLESINGSQPGKDQTNIVNQIANQLFINGNSSIISLLNSSNEYPVDFSNLLNVDNETLPIFQDFIVVLDDSQDLNETLLSGDGTISNILTNLNSNTTDFKIIFDPQSTVIGLDNQLEDDEDSVLTDIKNQINSAVTEVANICSNNICIQNIDEDSPSQMSIINKTESDLGATGLIMVESKNDKKSQLEQCTKAKDCFDPVPCMFAHSRCLQLSNIDILSPKTRKDMTVCKIESLKCLLEVKTMMEQDQCIKDFKRCTSMLGVDIYGGSIVNFVHHEEDPGNQKIEDQNESGEKNVTTVEIIEEIMQTLKDTLDEELGNDFNVQLVTANNESTDDLDTVKLNMDDFVSLQKSNESEKNIGLNQINSIANIQNGSSIVSIIKGKLNETQTKPLTVMMEQKPIDKFKMDLPELGISISVKEDLDLTNSTFGMSLPTFGFNITVDKDSSQCSVGSDIYNDFETIPTEDPCQICKCTAGEIECFIQECQPPRNGSECQQLPITEGTCCPKYDCNEKETSDTIQGRQDIPAFNVEDTLDMLDKVKESVISVLNDVAEDITETTTNSSFVDNEAISIIPKVSTSTDLYKSIGNLSDNEVSTLVTASHNSVTEIVSETLGETSNVPRPTTSSSVESATTPTNIRTDSLPKEIVDRVDLTTILPFDNTNLQETTISVFEIKTSTTDVYQSTKNLDSSQAISDKQEPTTNSFQLAIEKDGIPNDMTTSKYSSLTNDIPQSTKIPGSREPFTEPVTKENIFNSFSTGFAEDDSANPVQTESVTGLSVTSTTISQTQFTDQMNNSDFGTNGESIIGDKNVKVYLNFTWMDTNFTLEEDFYNPNYSNNLTMKIKDVLSSGVGYVIVPEGEQPEMNDDNTVHLIQTVSIDKSGNVDIKTSISNSSGLDYSDYDNDFIMKVENKTLTVTEDIFQEMQNNLPVTTTENLISTKISNENETRSDTTQLSVTDKNQEENKFTTESFTVGDFLNKKDPDLVSSDISQDSEFNDPEPIIYISLSNEHIISDPKKEEKELDILYILSNEVEDETGYKAVIFTPESELVLPKDESIFLVQGEITEESDVNIQVFKDRTSVDMLENPEKEEAIKIKSIVESKLNDILMSIKHEKHITTTEKNAEEEIVSIEDDNKEKQIPLKVLEVISNVMGLTILNHTADAQNDTLLIFQDILVNSDQFSNITDILNENEITEDSIPATLKRAIFAALNNSDIVPSESETLLGPRTTPPSVDKIDFIEDENIQSTSKSIIAENIEEEFSLASQQNLNPIDQVSQENDDESKIFSKQTTQKQRESLITTTETITIPLIIQDEPIRDNPLPETTPSSAKVSLNEEPIILVSIKRKNDQKDESYDLDVIDKIMKITNITTLSVSNEEEEDILKLLETHGSSYFVDTKEDSNGHLSANVFFNREPIDSLENVAEDQARVIEEIMKVIKENKEPIQQKFNFEEIQDSIFKTLSNVSNIIVLNDTGLINEADNETLIIFQDILIDSSGNVNVSSVISNENIKNNSEFDKLPSQIQDAVIAAIQNAEHDEDEGTHFQTTVKETNKLPTGENIDDFVSINFNFERPPNFVEEAETPITNIKIIFPTALFQTVIDLRDKIVPLILTSVMRSGIEISGVEFFHEYDAVIDADKSVIINYSNCSVTFNNNELRFLSSTEVEKVLGVFEEVDQVLKNFIDDVYFDMSSCLNEMTSLDSEADSKFNILISIKGDGKINAEELQTLKRNLENITNSDVKIVQNQNPIVIESILNESSTVLISVDTNNMEFMIENKKNGPKLTEKQLKALEDKVKSNLPNFESNNKTITFERPENSENKPVKIKSIISLMCTDCSNDVSKLKEIEESIEEESESKVIVLTNKRAMEIENKFKKINTPKKYLISINIVENGTSYGSVIDEERTPITFQNATDSENKIFESVKKVLKEEFNTVLKLENNDSISFGVSSTESSTSTTQKQKSSDRIINILTDLLIKTLHLSFRIKGAIDRNSENNQNVEFEIISRKDDIENDYIDDVDDSYDYLEIPDLIKITPEDAMFVHGGKDIRNSTLLDKPIVIELGEDQTVNFNVSNGMVFEIDLSNLPTSKPERDEEIRLRVRDFINGLELIHDKEDERDKPLPFDRSSLSDAIIKNITQIVLLQMDEALQKQANQVTIPPLSSKFSPTTEKSQFKETTSTTDTINFSSIVEENDLSLSSESTTTYDEYEVFPNEVTSGTKILMFLTHYTV